MMPSAWQGSANTCGTRDEWRSLIHGHLHAYWPEDARRCLIGVFQLPEVVPADYRARIRAIVSGAEWADGKITACTQSAQAKNNCQNRLMRDSDADALNETADAKRLAASAFLMMSCFARNGCPRIACMIQNHLDALACHRGTGEFMRDCCRQVSPLWRDHLDSLAAQRIESPLWLFPRAADLIIKNLFQRPLCRKAYRPIGVPVLI